MAITAPTTGLASADGTRIAFERCGHVPAVVLVDGAVAIASSVRFAASHRRSPGTPARPMLEAIAHTFVYDCTITDATTLAHASEVSRPS